jgi:hypothetical protein
MPNNSFGNIDWAGGGVKRRAAAHKPSNPDYRDVISRVMAALVAAIYAMTRSKCDNMSRTCRLRAMHFRMSRRGRPAQGRA